MSDLISRSVAIDEIWNVFNSYVNDDSRFNEFETEAINKAFKVLQNRIEKQPTAYDVEKVVAQLDEKKYWEYDDEGFSIGKVVSMGDAITIVRKGGAE